MDERTMIREQERLAKEAKKKKTKKYKIITSVVLAVALVGTVWYVGWGKKMLAQTAANTTVEIKKSAGQEVVIAQITSIKGNEITYAVAEEVMDEETRVGEDTKVESKEEFAQNQRPQSPGAQGERPSRDGQSGGEMPSFDGSSMPDMSQMPGGGEMPSWGGEGMPSFDGSNMPDMSQMPGGGEMPSWGGEGMPSFDGSNMPDMSQIPGGGEMPSFGGGGEMPSRGQQGSSSSSGRSETNQFTYDNKTYRIGSESITTYIPVGTDVTTKLGTVTTFSRLAADDYVALVIEKDGDEEVIAAVYIIG